MGKGEAEYNARVYSGREKHCPIIEMYGTEKHEPSLRQLGFMMRLSRNCGII